MAPKREQPAPQKRIDTNSYEIRKRQPKKPHGGVKTLPNHFYITKKTNIESQVNKIYDVLNDKADKVVIHGLGASLNRALVAALEVQKKFFGAVQFHITTSTVHVTDDLFPLSDEHEMGQRNRPLSAVEITFFHVQP